eukprot:129755-Pyramimonas_sp.AAC.1
MPADRRLRLGGGEQGGVRRLPAGAAAAGHSSDGAPPRRPQRHAVPCELTVQILTVPLDVQTCRFSQCLQTSRPPPPPR